MFRPDPHPLDYDWRFDADTVRDISRQIPVGRVLMMGCPSLAAALASAGREVSLVDIQPIDPCTRINYTRADIRFEHLRSSLERFDTIVLDSPWYIDYLKPWLIQARLRAGFGSLIMFSLWPSDTRPSALEEIKEIISLANSFGSVVIERGVLRYLTPKFESAAADGTGRRLYDRWRYGDLVTVRICKPLVQSPNPEAQDRSTSKLWRRYTFDTLQVALRRDYEPSSDLPVLRSIVKGDVLTGVSRRLAIRSKIDLWTSNNDVFSVTNSHAFAEALDSLAARNSQLVSSKAAEALRLLYDSGIVRRGPVNRAYTWQHLE